jgi:hypothetical protein
MNMGKPESFPTRHKSESEVVLPTRIGILKVKTRRSDSYLYWNWLHADNAPSPPNAGGTGYNPGNRG